MRLLAPAALAVAAVATLSVALPGDAAAQTVLRYAHVGAEGEAQTRYAEELAALIEEKTDGRIEVHVFPGSQLGNIAEMVDAVRIGSIAMAHHDFASLDRYEPDIGVFNAPFMYRDPEHAMRATAPSSPVLEEINAKLAEQGNVRVIGNFYRGARQLTARFPVYSPDDLEGTKIRAVPLRLWNTMVSGMGATPTPVEIAEIIPALMTGLVDGQENPLNNIIAQKMYEPNPYVMMTSHMESVLALFINEDVWQGLADEDRAAIEEAIAEMAERSLQWAREAEAEEREFLIESGVTFIEEDDGLDLEAFRTRVSAKVLEDFPDWAEYIERIKAIE